MLHGMPWGYRQAMLRRLGAWCVWWLALFWLWMFLVADWNTIEWVAGACAATVCATVAELIRGAARQPLSVPVERLRASALVPPVVVADFAIVIWALVQSVARRRVTRGVFITRPFDPGPKTTPRGWARRAWTVWLAGFSPNAYVIEIDEERGTVLLHDLVPWRRSEEPA
jgi:hypothetical protein